jgi:hypothetical protein
MTLPVSDEALATAVAVAREHGLRVDEPRVLESGHNLVVHLAPAPVVARIGLAMADLRPGAGRSALELAVWLHARGLPVQPPADALPAIAHERDGFVVTFWKLLPPEPGDPAEAGRALRAIQEALASYDGGLERFWPLTETRELARRTPGLPPIARDTIERAADALKDTSLVPQHGDAHDGNCLTGLWGDLEDVCLAPPEWDLACLRFCGQVDGDAWAARAAQELPAGDPERIEVLMGLRAALSAVWGLAMRGDAAHAARRAAWLEDQAAGTR